MSAVAAFIWKCKGIQFIMLNLPWSVFNLLAAQVKNERHHIGCFGRRSFKRMRMGFLSRQLTGRLEKRNKEIISP